MGLYQAPMYQPPMYQSPIYPQYQQNVQQMQPTQMTVASNGLQGRMVTSKEEALGVPVDFSGQPMLFPDLAHGVIYYKQFNAGTGSSDFREFRLAENAQANATNYVTVDQLEAIRSEIDGVKNELANMRKPSKGAKTNDEQ